MFSWTKHSSLLRQSKNYEARKLRQVSFVLIGATTLRIMTFCTTALGIISLLATLVMLSVFMLNVVMLSVTCFLAILNVVMLSFFMLNVALFMLL